MHAILKVIKYYRVPKLLKTFPWAILKFLPLGYDLPLYVYDNRK